MSEKGFDPEKVERYPQPGLDRTYEYVSAEDYDQLLALYREVVRPKQGDRRDPEANYSDDIIPGCSYNYGSALDRQFNPPNGTPRPKQ